MVPLNPMVSRLAGPHRRRHEPAAARHVRADVPRPRGHGARRGDDRRSAPRSRSRSAAAPTSTDLMSGEVTSIEGDFDELVHYTVVRGYEQAHRLQRARRSRTFLDSTDGDIARRVAKRCRPDRSATSRTPASPTSTSPRSPRPTGSSSRVAPSEIGYETGVVGGEFFFRPAPGMSAGGLGGAAAAAGVGGRIGGRPRHADAARSARTCAGCVRGSARPASSSEAEVRVWDPTGRAGRVRQGAAGVGDRRRRRRPGRAGRCVRRTALGMPAIPSIPFLPSFLGASNDAYVDRRPAARLGIRRAERGRRRRRRHAPSTSPARSPRPRAGCMADTRRRRRAPRSCSTTCRPVRRRVVRHHGAARASTSRRATTSGSRSAGATTARCAA